MLGAILALSSAAFFGLNNATVRRGVLKSTVLQGMAITVPLGLPIFAGFAFFLDGFEAMRGWPMSAWVWMMLAGVVHFVIGRYGNYRATQALGATLSTPIQQLSILVSLVLAFLFLDETVNLMNLFGIALIMGGPMLVVGRRKNALKAGKAKGFRPDFGPGLFWGAVCALGYGTSPLLISLGLGAAPKPADGIGGVFLSYVAATVVVALCVFAAGGRSYMRSLDRGSGGWFLISAICVALSQLFRYLALTVAPVSVVVPVQRLSVVFRIVFGALINRDHEVFDTWIIVSILLAIAGAAALTLDTEFLLEIFHVPAATRLLLSSPLF
ncbi:DMT family transporter [Labrenzia sp. OB1]|uniref:DMT family transporter n=1 Tax=Labrenzia sp. OB1 TaxID=1561204 RepID=UPI0007B28DEA|nr:DMT family transporter [Labrenzia sp. OB1]KZM49534.1 hypothetical protein OA90_13660 [Labrenzia sp. OB1]